MKFVATITCAGTGETRVVGEYDTAAEANAAASKAARDYHDQWVKDGKKGDLMPDGTGWDVILEGRPVNAGGIAMEKHETPPAGEVLRCLILFPIGKPL